MTNKDIFEFLNKFQPTSHYHISDWLIGNINYKDGKKSIIFSKFINEKIFLTSIKEPFDFNVIDAVILQIDKIVIENNITSYCKLSMERINDFDSVLFVGNEYQTWFKSFDNKIHRATVWFVPINHCEFSGLNPNEFNPQNMRHIDITNWERGIVPKILAKINNPIMGLVAQKKPYYDSEVNVYIQLEKFNNDAWMELINYKQEKLLITYSKNVNTYKITNKKNVDEIENLEELKSYLHLFFTL